MFRSHLLATACKILIGVGVASTSVMARAAEPPVSISIPGQDLAAALAQFGEQTKQPILFDPVLVRGKRAHPVSGTLTPQQALAKLLEGTALSYQQTSGGTLVLKQRGPAARPQPVAATAPAVAAATTPDATDQGLQDIIVTAQKRDESLQDVPASILAFESKAIEKLNISTIDDLRQFTPNLQTTPHPNSGSTSRVFIRGVGNQDDQLTYDSSVAVYLDGVYVSRSQGLAMDIGEIDRIEVLRGPQGTLYGRNATGGAINFITRAPRTDKFEGKLDLEAGNRDHRRLKAMINVPLADIAALRLSYMHVERDGFVRNRGTGVHRFGDINRDGYRADFLVEPTENLSIRYSYDRSEIGDTPQFITPVPLFPGKGVRPTAGSPAVRDLRRNDVIVQGHTLTMNWQLSEAATLRSITGYRKIHDQSYQDYNTGVFGPFPIIVTNGDVRQSQWTQELQLVGDAFDNALEYIVGAYYFSEKGDSFDTTAVVNRPLLARTVGVKNKAYAVFGQATYTPAFAGDRLHITLGGRWSKDERDASLGLSTVTGGVTTPQPTAVGRKTFSHISPSATLAYDVSDDVNLYAKVSDGYKTGGFNIRASSLQRFRQGFDEEVLTSYEVGLKGSFLDRRLRVNLAAFLSKYKDIQVAVRSDQNNPAISDVLNAGSGRIKGIELDVNAAPTDAIKLRFSYGFLDTSYSKIIDAANVDVASQFRFITAPRNSVSAGIDATLAKFDIGKVVATVNYSWTDDFFAVARIVPATYIIQSHGLFDARLAMEDIELGNVTTTVAIWGRNITDEKYYIGHTNGGVPSAIFGEPRAYGVSLTAQF